MTEKFELPEGTIIKLVKNIDRVCTPQEALDATERIQFTTKDAVDLIPHGEGKEIEVYLVPLKKKFAVDELEKEIDKIGFKLIDPITLCALNGTEPELADTIPNATQWRDENNKAYCVYFYNWSGERGVGVCEAEDDWYDHWFFGCVRK